MYLEKCAIIGLSGGVYMTSVSAYYDGSTYVVTEEVPVRQNQKVIITLLDEYVSPKHRKTLPQIKAYMKGGRSVPDGLSTVDYVRSLRED